MEPDYFKVARRLLTIPGVKLKFDGQRNVAHMYRGLSRGETRFESCGLHDPEVETFTHYLSNPGGLSEADELDLSYYNACSWEEETKTLGEQIKLVRQRFPDLALDIPGGA